MAELNSAPDPKGLFTFPGIEDTEAAGIFGAGGFPVGTKVYRALLSQIADNAPTAIVLENTLGGTIVWSYNAIGIYDGTLSGAFTADKTFLLIHEQDDFPDDQRLAGISRVSANVVRIQTAQAGTLGDSLITNISVQIAVYP